MVSTSIDRHQSLGGRIFLLPESSHCASRSASEVIFQAMATAEPQPAGWQERYGAAREALIRPRLRVVSGIALLLISMAMLIDILDDGEVLVTHWPTRILIATTSLVGLAVARTTRTQLQAAMSLCVFAACAVHLEGMIILAGDVGGGFPFLILLTPLAALLLPSTGIGVAALSSLIVGAHALGLIYFRNDGDARLLALELMSLASGCGIATWIAYVTDDARRRESQQQADLDEARRRSDELLQNILPERVAEQLKQTSQPIAQGFSGVTILFADLVDFTPLAGILPPDRLVRELNALFSAFDDEVTRRGLEKIKTIGDCYMVAAGLPEPSEDHAEAIVDLALWLRETISTWPKVEGHSMRLRIGINTGPVVAGVIGRSKFIYDLWGDAVNVASRMESTGDPGMVQITDATRAAMEPGHWVMVPRKDVEVKGKGRMQTWLVVSRSERWMAQEALA